MNLNANTDATEVDLGGANTIIDSLIDNTPNQRSRHQ
jgi:hypothetical protein